MELTIGLEPTTDSLQMNCATFAPRQHGGGSQNWTHIYRVKAGRSRHWAIPLIYLEVVHRFELWNNGFADHRLNPLGYTTISFNNYIVPLNAIFVKNFISFCFPNFMLGTYVNHHEKVLIIDWRSDMWESNSQFQLGRMMFYH